MVTVKHIILVALLYISNLGLAQNQSKVWIFGQGLGMDFNTQPPSFFKVPWQGSILGQASDDNQSSSLCNAKGELMIYFLNGNYYDGQQNLLAGGRSHNYVLATGSFHSKKTSAFIQKANSDTLLHYYLKGEIVTAGGLSATFRHTIRLNKLYKVNGAWQIDSLDTWGGYPLNVQDHWLQMKIFAFTDRHTQRDYIFFEGLQTLHLQEVTLQGFRSATYSPANLQTGFGLDPNYFNFYHPLLDQIFTMWGDPNASGRIFLKKIAHQGNLNFSEVGVHFPFVSPNDTANGLYRYWIPQVSATSYEGRYLYVMARCYLSLVTQEAKLIRYDLFASDSVAFKKSAYEVPLPISLKRAGLGLTIGDMQVGPDKNIYFTLRHPSGVSKSLNIAQNKVMGRIENAGNPDPSQIVVDMNYHTFNDWELYHSFPSYSAAQSMPPPFQLLSNCEDSVYFDLTYKSVTDSVWWDFGVPQLGSLNHSSLETPVLRYPAYGQYYVSVELYWNGNLLNTLGDTIQIEPIPTVNLPNDTLLCTGDSLFIDARQGFEASYLWSTGSNDSTLTVGTTGTYWVEVNTACGTATDTVLVHVIDPPSTTLKDTVICESWSLELEVYADSATYLWNDGSTNSSFEPQESGLYQVAIENPCGMVSDQSTIEITKCECKLWVASAFTPNGDGLNDVFEIITDCRGLEYQIDFYNRWGALVYRHNQDQPYWDGTYNDHAVRAGVYTYKLTYSGLKKEVRIEGTEFGTVAVIR